MIYIVGAGPGAEDLITIRGVELLKKADTIIYAGSLVNPGLLKYAKDACSIHDSAKMTLEEVISVMEKDDGPNKIIVRLHTGDPCIYGAIREQMDILDSKGMEYEYVPGVSSFIGAASALKAEYTLPNVSQTVILTRMAGRTPVPEKEEIESLASHQATMIIFLTSTMLKELSRRLIEGGYSPDTPAAIVYKATWPDQKVIRTTVENIAVEAEKEGINKMALICVGNFLGDNYDRSKLYHPEFTHLFREGKQETD
ncbi:MAG: precorrin-4 C(11)-methyltransferase [Clostridiales bacterium]|nr:precorrin-4 C(11)-methyltransferase [Clostridiales bacterium]MDY6116675.1 precorrin-4 C(11)-methyltransferase [Anaerovoracaceae bacterium]